MLFHNTPLNRERALKELDVMGYSDRMKQMATWGCQYKGDAAYSDLLTSLLKSDSAYEGHLALTGASVTHDAHVVLAALNHGKAGVRCRAAKLLPKVLIDSDFLIESEIVSMSHECRRQLLRSIVIRGRQDWAERLLPLVLANWGGHEAATLLAACSEETVRRHLPELGYGVRNWKMLTQRHPDLVADYFHDVLQKATQREKTFVWWSFSSAIEMLCELKPSMVLECALKHGPTDVLHPVLRPRLGRLMEVSPDDVFKLLTREEARSDLLTHGVPVGVLKKTSFFPSSSGQS